ncbi:hemolysin family protein [Clostridium fallax]|uniref:Putative hemolysin n=1 Tax=Clostridium fallax TaxID=1533 RepID=A0A1M4TDA2_9CLOT|nr:hemolysin family protein [Clostridium fallax]SHE42345.1 putative hemolysin [Clostridium fallax]SQB22708.1 CBS/transporter domain protein [Clostridium fallax]
MDSGPVGSMLIQLMLIVILILVNAFFASAESAILSINKNKINSLIDKGDKRAKDLLAIIEEPNSILPTIQVGITTAGFLASAIAATTISNSLASILSRNNIPFSNTISMIFITLMLCYVTLVFGEIIPKKMAIKNPEGIALNSMKPIKIAYILMRPFIKILSFTSNALLKIINIKETPREEKVSKDIIKSLIETGEEQGALNSSERDMLEGIIEFDNKMAKEVMTPRTEVFSLSVDAPIREISSKLLYENFSRVPVYEKEIDNIIGILYMKDFFYEANRSGIDNIDLKKILRKPYFVPQSKAIDELFFELKDSKNHMAVLIDEYGGFSGIVTIEDLIEEVMGDIFDEYDEAQCDIKKIDEKTYVVDGLLSINELNERLNVNIETDCFETIGGFVVSLIGNIPKKDESKKIKYEDIIFEVEEISSKRIEKIKLCLAD